MMMPGQRMERRTLTLIVVDSGDQGMSLIGDAVDASVADGIARGFLRVVIGRNDTDADAVRWSATHVTSGGPTEVNRLFDRVAREGRVGRVQVVAVCTAAGDPAMAHRLSDAVDALQRALDQLLGHGMQVVHSRLAITGYSEGMVDNAFFSPAGARNLAVIPLDRTDDASAARPLERSDRSAFRDHGAIELMTVCGLWNSVHQGPLGDIPVTLATDGEPVVRLVQSGVRFLRTPPIPARELVDPSRELPLPEQFLPANNPSRRVNDLFDQVRAQELAYAVAEPPPLRTLGLGLGALVRMVSRDVRDVLRELPRIIVKAVRGEVAILSQQVAQQALGSDSRIQVRLGDAIATATESTDVDAEAFADRLERLMRRSDLELVDPVPGDIWTMLSGRILGILDGDPASEPFRREALGDAAVVVTDRAIVTGGVPWDTMWAMEPDGPRVVALDEFMISRTVASADWVSELFDLNGPPALAAEPGPERLGTWTDLDEDDEQLTTAETAADSEEDRLATDETEDSASAGSDDAAEDAAVLRIGERQLPELIDAADDGILVRVLTDLRRQRRLATLDVRRLISMARKDETQEDLVVSKYVPMLAVLGLALIFFDIGVSDVMNRFVMATGWVIAVRDLGFVAATLAIAFSAVAVSDLFRGKDGAARTVILVTLFLTNLVGAAIFRLQLRSRLSVEALDGHFAATFLGLVVLGLVALAVVQAIRSADEVRVGAARLLGFGALIYSFVGVTVSQARDGSWMRGISADLAGRVDTLLIVAGTVLFLSAISVLQFMRFRATRRLDSSEHRRTWAAEQVAVALDARVRLQSAEWQWIGTASVLARLVQHPFGVAHPVVTGSVLGVEDPEVLKGVRATLLLTNAGREAIDSKLRSILITPSWLRQQYELLVREFQAILARRTGNAVGDLQDRRPEQDVHAPILESGDGFDARLLRGDRWEFARRVAAGEFDRVLARSADSLDLEEVYGPLLAEPGAMLLEGNPSEDGEGLVRDFIQRLLPTEPPEVPSGVTDVLFSGEDERRRMATWIWWPEGLLGELTASSFIVRPTRFVRERAEGALVVTAIRFDLSDPFRHDQCLVIPENRQVADITRSS